MLAAVVIIVPLNLADLLRMAQACGTAARVSMHGAACIEVFDQTVSCIGLPGAISGHSIFCSRGSEGSI